MKTSLEHRRLCTEKETAVASGEFPLEELGRQTMDARACDNKRRAEWEKRRGSGDKKERK